MKSALFILIFLVSSMLLQAQDITISFTGSGSSNIVDSVKVQNLTQCSSLIMNGTDTLHLLGVVGIEPANVKEENKIRIHPNPMTNQSLIEFYIPITDDVTVNVFEISGKLVFQSRYFLPFGYHVWSLSGLRNGIYTIQINTKGQSCFEKLISLSQNQTVIKLDYISGNTNKTLKGSVKRANSLLPMQYNSGDKMLFTCYSSTFRTKIPIVPIHDTTINANFVECVDADGRNYSTVKIGTQVWMAQNLNVGTTINGGFLQHNNGIIEKYCTYDMHSYCDIYGGLYQWSEMMQYSTTPGIQGICPNGWHIPVDSDYTILQSYLGGHDIASGKMKQACEGTWYDNSISVNDSSGFGSVAAGIHDYTGYFEQGLGAYLWTSNNSNGDASAWVVRWDQIWFAHWDWLERLAFSVRCIKN